MFSRFRRYFALFPLAVLTFALRPDALNLSPPAGRMSTLPTRALWVWERSEDLTSINPANTSLAVLDRTILIGHAVTILPRRQPVIYPEGATRIAVVRIETEGSFSRVPITPKLVHATADRILDALNGPPAAALQIDFDARLSERGFYTALLRELRRRMTPEMPLSITALASWCSNDDWIAALPVDEAVPMFFRMEPGRRAVSADLPWFRIREPLCQNSIGISTRESHPSLAGKRVYIFPDRGWHNDLPLIAVNDTLPRTEP